LKSALFVDFDNVYSQLRQLQPDAAERFARHPSEWIGWLTGSLALPEPHHEAQRRRLLVRRCYLNPNWYQAYRHAFLRAGFEIVDCPPVTSQGKTSTDIHLVLDVVDLLQHETHYDEFIVFSADADFTPLLRKLRRFDRRTTVLAIGFPSAAYQASADLLIDERVFIQDALGLGRAAAEAAHATNGPTIETVEARPAARLDSGARLGARAATSDELSTIAHRIWTTVDESTGPVSAALLASRLKQDFAEVTENWNGCGTFKAFFRALKLSRLAWVSGSGGRILDPSRHEVEGTSADQEPDSPWAGSGGMFPVVREVCSLTGAPMLAPKDLQMVLTLLACELREHGFELAATARGVCSRCLETAGLRVRQRDVTFLLRGMQLNGHVFGQGHDDETTLASRLVDQVLFLCAREQMVLDEPAVGHIRHWIAGAVAA
jgi:NYN domain